MLTVGASANLKPSLGGDYADAAGAAGGSAAHRSLTLQGRLTRINLPTAHPPDLNIGERFQHVFV